MRKFLLFDTETTGNGVEDRIIQVGGILLGNGKEPIVYNELCSTQKEISFEAMAVHHIIPEDIKDKLPFLKSDFYAMLQENNDASNFLIAHNISFDLEMLQKEGFENNYILIDTLRCAKHLLPDERSHALQYLRYSLGLYKDEKQEAQKLGITIQAHDAIGDVLVMKLLLSKLKEKIVEKYPNEDVMNKLKELTNTPVVIRIFKFGKYKDRLIEEIAMEDGNYLAWMLKSLELDEDMQYTLKLYIN
ncbi:MAG: 3'-5' exonuclease [Campylobacterales bacterium]|nr:3'-5' exonuclease [Campylobacterales bacterium]